MAWKRRPFRAFNRRFSKPLAHKKLLWTTTVTTHSVAAATVSSTVLLAPSQWIENSTAGNFEKAVIKRLVLIAQAGAAVSATNYGSCIYALNVDDSQDTQADPSVAASYSDMQPFHVGTITLPPTTLVTTPPFFGYSDNTRVFKVNRKVTSQDSLFFITGPSGSVTFNNVLSLTARMLLELD